MLKNAVGSAMLVRLAQDHRRPAALMAGVLAALLAFGVAERSADAQSEPKTVGAVTGLTATAEGQADGTVRLTWSAAENAQVYFVLYLKEEDFTAGNYSDIRMRAFNGTEATIDGLEAGASYHFIARGMRYNISTFEDFWGAWSSMATVAAAGVADGTATTPDESQPMPAEPETVGTVAGLLATVEGQPPGSVHLIWNAAENAQVYFVLFVKADDLAAGNYTGVQMRVFNDTEATIDGLEGGASYHFIARGMRYNISTFKEVWGDNWSSMTTATPTAEPTIAFADLPRADRLDPAQANQLKALPWIADGIVDSERDAAQMLIDAARNYPDTFSALLQKTWVTDRDMTAAETRAIHGIRWSAKYAPALAAQMLEKPWTEDDITRDEASALYYLYRITHTEDESLREEVIQQAINILAMPFLDRVESPDALAVWDLSRIARTNSSDFLDVMASDKVSDGITNQEAKVVTVLSSANRYKPDSLPILLDGLDGTGGVYLEERAIELDLSGEVQLTIIRVIDKDTPNMDRLEHAVRVVEEFMGEPLPTNYVAWYLDDAARSAGKGYHAGTHITSSLAYDIVDGDSKSRTPMQHIAHEVGHYYFRGNTHQWLDEGPAKFFESISERERVGRPVAYFRQSCGPAKTIQEQEQLRNDINAGRVTPPDGWTSCDYYLGERFFVDLYLAMGDDAFRPGLRSLYLKSQHDDPTDDCDGTDLGLCHVEAAFKANASDDVAVKVDEVIDRWYYGIGAEESVSLDDLERADRLGPAQANQLKALPWIADGIDDSERDSAEKLVEAAIWWPDTFNALLQKSWIQDAITRDEATVIEHVYWLTRAYRDEATKLRVSEAVVALLDMPFLDSVEPADATAVMFLQRLASNDLDTFDALLRKPWIQDAITGDEATVIEHIYWLTLSYSDEATRLRISEEVVALLDMPFLDSVESPDALAVWSLQRIAGTDTSAFLDIMSHSKISDGITDEEAKIVVLLWEANQRNQASLQALLDGLDGTGGVYKEERTTNLPHSGEVLLAIIRFRDNSNASMDYFEHAARNVEEFMGEPLGSNYVAWYFGDAIGGHHAGTHITSEPSHDDVNHPYWQDTPAHIAHEVGHYYWTSARGTRWISEGGAELVSAISEHERIGRPLEPFRTHCAEFQAIKDIVPTGGLPHASCDYYLGSQLFLNLYHTLGEETFRQRFHSLYLKSQSDDPTDDCEGTYLDICHVEAAFKAGASDDVVGKVDEVIDRWYYGIGAEEPQIPGREDLYQPIQPPMAPAHINWGWGPDQGGIRELVTDITIHNDVGNWSDQHGLFLILIQNHISDTGFYFGLQTDANWRGKAVIFSRWETDQLTDARWEETNGWYELGKHEGGFLGVRRSYDWSAGDYRILIAPDGLESDGEWFGLWITDLSTNETTWIGSLKFPLLDGTATMQPHSSATIELYGNPLIRPIDVPEWHVSVKRPLGDGVPATWGFTHYPYDDSENALPNSDVNYDVLEDVAHLRVGGLTERTNAAVERIDFKLLATLDDLERADRLEPAQANQLEALPWIADGIDELERDAAQMLIDAARVYPDTFTALMQKTWVTDHDMTAAETSAIHGIRWADKRQ